MLMIIGCLDFFKRGMNVFIICMILNIFVWYIFLMLWGVNLEGVENWLDIFVLLMRILRWFFFLVIML